MSFQLCRTGERILNEKIHIPSLTYEDIRDLYGTNGELYFKFKIQIVNNSSVPISGFTEIIIDSHRKFHQCYSVQLAANKLFRLHSNQSCNIIKYCYFHSFLS